MHINQLLQSGFASIAPLPSLRPIDPPDGDAAPTSTPEIPASLAPVDRADISPAALRAAQIDPAQTNLAAKPGRPAEESSPSAEDSGPTAADDLTTEEQQEVTELETRDREVRAHEQAHKASAGQYGGAISYEYETGPDGKRYVTGGSVPIDTSPVAGDPEATIAKMEQVRAAALAPADPSSADRSVATQAQRNIAEARREMAESRVEESGPAGATSAAMAADGVTSLIESPQSSTAAASQSYAATGLARSSGGAIGLRLDRLA